MFGGQQPTRPQYRLYHVIISPRHHNYFSILLTLLCTHLNNYLYFTHSMKLLWKTEKLWLDGWIHFRRKFEGLKTEANFFFHFTAKTSSNRTKEAKRKTQKMGRMNLLERPFIFPMKFSVYPCNLISYQQCNLFMSCTIFCSKLHPFPSQ